MKVCGTCKVEKHFEDFGVKKRKGDKVYYQSKCRECNREYQKQHYRANKKTYYTKARTWEKEHKRKIYSFLMEHAKEGCVVCGEKDFRCLQFNHIDREQKTDSVSGMISAKRSFELIIEEVKKCEVVCANCHCKITAKQFDWYSILETSGE